MALLAPTKAIALGRACTKSRCRHQSELVTAAKCQVSSRGVTSRRTLIIRNFTHDSGQNAAIQILDDELNASRETEAELLQRNASLPQLQVQTFQEQAKISATPAHPDSLYAMYATYVAACFMERVWRFGLPVVISLLYDSLLPVAMLSFAGQVNPSISYLLFICMSALYGIHFSSCLLEHAWHFALPVVLAILHRSLLPVAAEGFVSQLVIFAGGPWVGALMDSQPRVLSFKVLSIVQTSCMLLSAGVVVYALGGGALAASSTSGLVRQPWFLVLIFAGAIERLAGLAIGVAFERDWVVLLAGASRSIALANANANLRRVDLICEIAGPFLFGVLLSRYNPVVCICLAATAIFASLPVLIFLVHCTNNLSKGVLDRPKAQLQQDGVAKSEPSGLTSVKQGWIHYLAQPILPASLAYVLLYFNAVLGPGGLMTSFLTQRGLNPSIIGGFRGMCAVMGFVATFVSSSLIARFGVLMAGFVALFFQAAALFLAVSVFWSTQVLHQSSLLAFLVLIVVSRLGFWVYDMVDAQIFQTSVPASQANIVGTTEISLASLAELVMMGVAILASDVSHFGRLAALSVSAVIVAAWIYWRWLSRAPQEQKGMFP